MRTLALAALLAGTITAGWPGIPQAPAQSPCADLGGVMDTVDAEQVCRLHSSTPAYTMELKFPVDYPDQQELTDYVTQNRDGFIAIAQTPGARGLPYEMEATPEQHRSGQPPKGTRSVVLKIFQDVGGPRPSTWYKTFNYDIAAGRTITFDSLFAPGSKPLDAIFPVVQRELGREAGMPGLLIPPGDGLDPAHYQNFAITDDELIFYFAPGELQPLNAGASTVRVPRNTIPPLAV